MYAAARVLANAQGDQRQTKHRIITEAVNATGLCAPPYSASASQWEACHALLNRIRGNNPAVASLEVFTRAMNAVNNRRG